MDKREYEIGCLQNSVKWLQWGLNEIQKELDFRLSQGSNQVTRDGKNIVIPTNEKVILKSIGSDLEGIRSMTIDELEEKKRSFEIQIQEQNKQLKALLN